MAYLGRHQINLSSDRLEGCLIFVKYPKYFDIINLLGPSEQVDFNEELFISNKIIYSKTRLRNFND